MRLVRALPAVRAGNEARDEFGDEFDFERQPMQHDE